MLSVSSFHHPPGRPFLLTPRFFCFQFTILGLPPGNYTVTIHDDKGPPGDTVYAVLETPAYIAFPPVWPFLFRLIKRNSICQFYR